MIISVNEKVGRKKEKRSEKKNPYHRNIQSSGIVI